MRITFLGAAEEVTGSCFLVETSSCRFLVDCGMFQGGRDAERKNREALDFDVRVLDFVLLTHAHIDHSGLLPRLSMLHYRGPVYCTAPTRDLLKVMLLDSAHIQEKEAEREVRHRHRARRSREPDGDHAPLYTVTQALESLKRLRAVHYDEEVRPHDRVRCTFRDAGHILGSSFIEVAVEEGGHTRRVVFSGDLGQPGHPLIRDYARPGAADAVIMESTYGNRLHKPMAETLDELAAALTETLAVRKGNVVIPAFAVGRTQDVLYLLVQLYREGRVPDHMQIYVDSPMALAATKVMMKHHRVLDGEAGDAVDWLRENGKPAIRFTQEVEDSIALNRIASGAVIISASGMCEAGRIKYHLRQNLPREQCAVVIAGFQAGGTLGRRLVDGAHTVRLFGDEVPVRARIHTIGGLSAHADQDGLLGWLSGFPHPPARAFLVHGEKSAMGIFRDEIVKRLGWPSVGVPAAGETVTL
jgi:metallo-beta-lactamase family protein